MLTPGICPLHSTTTTSLSSFEVESSETEAEKTFSKRNYRQKVFPHVSNSVTVVLISSVLLVLLNYVSFADAQALNDPITQYIEGRLGNRRIFWCPSGYGYLAYCPQPTDWDNYNWCCTWPYMGSWKPSCCPFALPTGAVVAIIIASIILVAVLVGLSCWCCFCCPLYKKLYEYEDEEDYETSQQQQLRYSSNR